MRLPWSSGGPPSDPMVKKSPSNEGDVGEIPGQGTKIPQCLGISQLEKSAHRNKEPMNSNKHATQPKKEIINKIYQ